MALPTNPSIYHITHAENLPSIIAEGGILSDSAMIARGGAPSAIGMSTIKARRLELPVKCHAGAKVGDCVPFYFCPRSIMLFVIHRANNPELAYRGGQGPIVHLEASLHEVVAWADKNGRRWAFTLSNAGAAYTQFRKKLEQLSEIDWDAVEATDFRPSDVKEGKQAEFLLQGACPWSLIRRVGVRSIGIRDKVEEALEQSPTKPSVEIRPSWYY